MYRSSHISTRTYVISHFLRCYANPDLKTCPSTVYSAQNCPTVRGVATSPTVSVVYPQTSVPKSVSRFQWFHFSPYFLGKPISNHLMVHNFHKKKPFGMDNPRSFCWRPISHLAELKIVMITICQTEFKVDSVMRNSKLSTVIFGPEVICAFAECYVVRFRTPSPITTSKMYKTPT